MKARLAAVLLFRIVYVRSPFFAVARISYTEPVRV